MASDSLDTRQRLEALERRVAALETENRDLRAGVSALETGLHDKEAEAAYMYVYLHLLWVRWVLVRDQDRFAGDPERQENARSCETRIRDDLSKHLRNVKFAPKPMDIAYKWRIDTTVILNRHGYTFLD